MAKKKATKKKATKKKATKKKAAGKRTKKSAYQQLTDAGLVSPGMLSTSERNTVNKMSDAEVRLLIKLAGKLGEASRPQARPNFPL